MYPLQTITIATVAAATLLFGSTQAEAQALNTWCEDQARLMCGDPGRNMSLATCMDHYDLWPLVPNECLGDLQTMIEMAREANDGQKGGQAPTSAKGGFQPQGAPAYRSQMQGTTNVLGYSYGGILREGPGTEFRRMAGLQEGDYVEILEATGIWWEGYQWYRVATYHGTGFHWGGIFCNEGGIAMDGVLSSCN